MSNEPQTLLEAVRHFADPNVTHNTMVELRWPFGVHCPTCGRTDVRFIATRRMWECKEKHPKKQFSSKVGTIFEDSPLSLDKWFVAIWQIANCKNGVSSYELARAIGVTQKSAWFMLHRIRLAMQTGSFIKSGGDAEADETFIGGLAKNMHKAKRAKVITGTGGTDKAMVMGILRRGGAGQPSRVKAGMVQHRSGETLKGAIKSAVELGQKVYTDALPAYRGLSAEYVHEVIDHAVEYVRDHIHTNGIENFCSFLKRTIKGTYVSVEPFHLDAYVTEQTFRFNERKKSDSGRFRDVLGAVAGKRITYKELTHATEATA
jgi:transposase-like protein